METYLQRHPFFKDFLGLVVFALCVFAGTMLINSFVFRSFNVEGQSMEKTMYGGDRLIVNRIPVTWSQLQNKEYVPERGQIIIFKNPQFSLGNGEEFIVKRVIAFAGERVVLANGEYRVYNSANPNGFNPDDANHGEPGKPTSGTVDTVVPEGTLFVSGDHREGAHSLDSRNGLGFIPLYDIIGPVSLRIYPFTAIRTF
jgi:signal peptidase I